MNNRKIHDPREQTKRGSYLVLLQVIWVGAYLAAPVYPTLFSTAFWNTTAIPREALLILFWSNALLMGTLGMYHIRKYLTPLPYPVEHNQLVTSGVYSLVRHPLYSSQLFAAFGWALYSLSLSHLLLTALGALFFNYKASREEEWLTQRHPAYANYRSRVKKFIPWIY